MTDQQYSEVMQMLGRVDQRVTGLSDEIAEVKVSMGEHLKVDDIRIDKIERLMHDERIRDEERSKYRGAEKAPQPTVANINLDPKVTKAVIGFLAAATSFLIFLQSQGG